MEKRSAMTILRWGLAFTFFYAAVASLLNPADWIGYMPMFLKSLLPARILLAGFSFYEILVAALLFSGRKVAYASIISAVTLGGITILNLGALDVTFRDIGLVFAALALYELAKEQKGVKEEIV